MTAIRNRSNHPDTPGKRIAEIYTPIDKYPPRTNHEQLRRDKRIGRAATAVAATAIIVGGGAYVGNHGTDDIEQQTVMPTKTEQEMVGKGLQAKAAAEHKPTTTVTEVKPSTYHVRYGDSLNRIVQHHVVDADGKPFEGDLREVTDPLSAQVYATPNHILDNTDVLTAPQNYYFVDYDTRPDENNSQPSHN